MTPLRQRMLETCRCGISPAHAARMLRISPGSRGTSVGRLRTRPEEIRTYQVYLVRDRALAPSSVEIAVCALRFLYKVTLKKPWSFDDLIPAPKKPRRLPVVLSPDEVVRVLECVTLPKHRASSRPATPPAFGLRRWSVSARPISIVAGW